MEREHLQQHLVDLLYDELPEELKHEVQQALKEHPDCAQELDEMREIHLLAESAPTLEVPAKVHNDILREARLNAHQKTTKEKTSGSFFVRWLNSPAFASALVVCLVLGVGVLLQRQAQDPGPTVSPEAQSITLASEHSESRDNTVAAIGGESEDEDGYLGETSLDHLAPSPAEQAENWVDQQNVETVAQLESGEVTGMSAVVGNGDAITTPQPDDDYWALAAREVPSGTDEEPVEEEPALADEDERLRQRRESENSNVQDVDFSDDDDDDGDYHTAWRDDDDDADDDGWAEGEADLEYAEEISVGYGTNRVYGGQESSDPAMLPIDNPVPQVDIEWPRSGDDGTVTSEPPLQLAILDDANIAEDELSEPSGFAPGLAPETEETEGSPDEERGLGTDVATRPQAQEYDDGLRRLNDGSYRDAIVHFDNFIQDVPHTSDFLNSALFYQGQAQMELGDYQAAAENFIQIVESPVQFEYHVEAQFLLAQALELNGEYELAETNYLNLTVFDNDFNELATEGLLRLEGQRAQTGDAGSADSTQLETTSEADDEGEEAEDAAMEFGEPTPIMEHQSE